MSALPQADPFALEVERLLREAGGDARVAIRKLLIARERDVSSGYVRSKPGAPR